MLDDPGISCKWTTQPFRKLRDGRINFGTYRRFLPFIDGSNKVKVLLYIDVFFDDGQQDVFPWSGGAGEYPWLQSRQRLAWRDFCLQGDRPTMESFFGAVLYSLVSHNMFREPNHVYIGNAHHDPAVVSSATLVPCTGFLP